ncbi:hypothetical protein [Roseibium sp.]|uniref:hypothetical protein n=1 Tax=Roseibium sp. TaxID=1936156 RepID=UPI0032662FD6
MIRRNPSLNAATSSQPLELVSGASFSGMPGSSVRAGRFTRAVLLASILAMPAPLHAQAVDCDSYARAYANAHTSSDPTDLDIIDGAMEGAVAGGAWRGHSGARRGAAAGGALAVLDSLGNDPAGWRGLYDMAYRTCRNSQSPVTHRPSTLGDPSYRPARRPDQALEPPMPAVPRAPRKPDR